MTRAERRRQERKAKALWLRRLLRGRFVVEWFEKWARERAPRLAHHHGCGCGMCDGYPQYLRHRDVKLARREGRRVSQDDEDE